MSANEGLKLLIEMEKDRKEKILSGKTLLCVLGHVGSKLPKLNASYLTDLQKKDFREGLHTLILPGKLHFMDA